MRRVVIIGSGIIGAAIAYELSSIPHLRVTLVDRQVPASGSTGAALGLLMGVISQKTKGRSWRLRCQSLERYETLLPELESLTGETIPCNRRGLVKLLFSGDDWQKWEKLSALRRDRGWDLQLWDSSTLQKYCPQINRERAIAAVYSPRDWQIDPSALTRVLVKAARMRGVKCKFGVMVRDCLSIPLNGAENRQCDRIETTEGILELDELIVAAGLGSTPLSDRLKQPVKMRPVLGQALHLQLPHPLGNLDFQPVITGNDIHIVPLEGGEYRLGATVEFPDESGEVTANPVFLEKMREEAISFCPDLARGEILRSWWGKRPRPEGQPAPIITRLSGYSNVFLATGHYRNGVLLAPATALAIRELIVDS
ncbi:MAG: FAD-binding oxidoreductase [Cyanobacteria bacterium SBLK]|nr:FAD-binding oxidoreductase [Cyanobacteria bacterium SBLK]